MGAIDAGLLRRTASRGSHFFCKQAVQGCVTEHGIGQELAARKTILDVIGDLFADVC